AAELDEPAEASADVVSDETEAPTAPGDGERGEAERVESAPEGERGNGRRRRRRHRGPRGEEGRENGALVADHDAEHTAPPAAIDKQGEPSDETVTASGSDHDESAEAPRGDD